MASQSPVSLSLKPSIAAMEPKSLNPGSSQSYSNVLLQSVAAEQPEAMVVSQEGHIGCLDVYIHHARDIHNICIYHKQDVYAKIYLTDNPANSVSSKTINGGGRNPVFDENLWLNVRTIDSSLKCEIWMLSRVRNYLEDQLLGFALVPLAEVVLGDGKLTQDFSLSSTDLFHSPAGFVQLSLSYVGSSPEVMAIPSPSSAAVNAALPVSENGSSIPCELVKIEFPDLKVVNENHLMVSEYVGIPCDNLEAPCSDSMINSENDNCPYSDAGIQIVESFSAVSVDKDRDLQRDTPPTTISTNGSPADIPATTSQSLSNSSGVTESPKQEGKAAGLEDSEVDDSDGHSSSAFNSPFININIQTEQTVVQQDIVDMYMKSMQQFTESLAKMRLPMDVETNNTNLETTTSSVSEQKEETPKSTGSRVFYGSRAFF